MGNMLSRDKEKLILDAAQHRFASYGYSKVTMDEIAEDVGMAKASLYYYFPTKEAIFRSVIQHEQVEFLSCIKTVIEGSLSAGQKFLEYIQLRIKLTEQLSNLSHFHKQGWNDVKSIFKDLFTEFLQQELQQIAHILQEGKKNHEFRLDHPQKTASMILHILQGLHLRFFRGYDHQAIVESDRVSYEQETLLFAETILHGISSKS
ncbi:MAG: TetR/AcrR family transcriptional regulator [Ignavibacteriales bacterium]|nr:TetR/AcrR family transcriptional regulator [Ignavibacteriales bacterium]